MMSFVVIVEPEEVNADRIRAILETTEKNFEYELVTSPESAIDLLDIRQIDVLISDMKMPVMTGSELFSMFEMISPDTVRIAMTDAKKIAETVAFMNDCRAFKVIIKPCRVADDLLSPIMASIEYKEMKQRNQHEKTNAKMGTFSSSHDYKKMEAACLKNEQNFLKVQDLFAQLLAGNLKFGNFSPEVSYKIKSWYEWMMSEYIQNNAMESGNFEERILRLKSAYHHPETSCTFQIKKISSEEIPPVKLNELSFLLHLMVGMCHQMLRSYQIHTVIETAEKAYILRFSCKWKIHGKLEADDVFLEPNEALRKVLYKAAEACVDSFGYKSVTLEKEDEIIVNIAVRR